MSGPAKRAYFSLLRPGGPKGGLRARLAAAVALSVLLHALVIVVPWLGTGARAVRDAPRSLDVRLERGEVPAPPAATLSATASVVPPVPPPPYLPPSVALVPGPAPALSRGLDVLATPANPYFTAEQLTRQPEAASQPLLTVPRQTARYVSGQITMKIWISARGSVDDIEVERSNLPATVSSFVVEAFSKLRFAPGEVDGRPVGVLMRVEIAYVDGRVMTP
jgi:hypothetical protein